MAPGRFSQVDWHGRTILPAGVGHERIYSRRRTRRGSLPQQAIVATLIQTARLNGVEPLAWLTDVLQRIVSSQTKRHQLETLVPWNWNRQQREVAPFNSE